MKKIAIVFISIFLSAFSAISFAESTNELAMNSLFGTQKTNTSVVQTLSENQMGETKGGARSYQYVCRNCTAYHGGVYSPNVCHNCYNKGHR
jgi:hypothetical protein